MTHPVAPAFIAVLASVLAYSGITRCGFIGLDDDLYVYENMIVSQGLTWEGVRWAFSAFFASTWQPLVWLSYMTDVMVSGVDPAAMHRTNLLLHLINVSLVYACLLKLTGRKGIAFLVACLFGVHPIHVESVAWIAGRKDLLSTPFWWAAILAYISYTQNPSRLRYGVIILAMLLGLSAKPMLMTLPAILILLDIWPLKRVSLTSTNGWLPVVIEKWPLVLASFVSFGVTLYVQTVGGSILDIETISLWGRFSNAIISIWRYIGKLLWPVNLAILYPHPGSWPIGTTLLASVGGVLVATIAWKQRRQYPALMVMLAAFLITLLPVSGLIQFGWHAMADRFLYIPAIALYSLVAAAIAKLWQRGTRWHPALAMTLCALFLALIARTHDQVANWHSSLTLFSHAVTVTEDNWMMHNGVGAALSRAGRNDQAAPHFEKAIALKPDRPKLHFNLGHVRYMQGRWAEAASCFQQSVALLPTKKAYFNLGAARAQLGEFDAAEAAYREVLQRSPLHIPAMIALADICRATEQHENAIVIYNQILALDAENQRARTGLGLALLANGKTVEALKALVEVLKDDPTNAEAKKAVQQAMTPTSPSPPQ